MHGEGRFSLIRLFKSFAMIGAEWVMWILVALSILSVAFMLERGRFYWSLADDLDKLARDLRDLLLRNDVAGAKRRLSASPSPAASIALAGLEESDRGAGAADEAMMGATARARMGLERNLTFLGTVGNNAPFIGLLGTVIGIIQAFEEFKRNQGLAVATARGGNAAQAMANASQSLGATERIMGSISEALVATAIGLFVAIPAVAAYNSFQRKVRGIVASGETLTHVVLAHLRGEPMPVIASAPATAATTATAPAASAAKGGAAAKGEGAGPASDPKRLKGEEE